ncbi:MAG: zinc metallopeptidase [Eubacteriales bacterium]|jgi:Zn-dependent membrane protease YugP|uniref:Zinc metallopeptidase n=1 Tax=Baileyella intestinalis TaxID=2606709 RepID=A0A6A8MAB4_9FIRM|nr:zinc metallopeptidase [Baileyella intestinalis]MCI7686416.1 zinc metallopeptidase [Clostridiales bacterium]MDD5874743.1 zinc metallopeptidase [Baileyella intestinalis]MDY2995076.1 zinc metallopeptidase [Baileyella intestinalis]MST68337.1 zinc metallopeptidase [Baileyella intestinalis]
MYYYGGLGYYSSMIVLIPAMIFTIIVQANIKSAFNRYSNITNSRRITGREAARLVLDSNGLTSVPVNIIGGDALTNYYDPSSNSVNLSRAVGETDSIASMCIACHEVGHAIQHARGYFPIKIRNFLVPVVNLTSRFSWPLIFLGLLLSTTNAYGSLLFNIGTLCFVFVVLFHLVTLPVELNASSRALKQMEAAGIVDKEDMYGSRKVLRAAAMTYVAALATAVASLLRIMLLRNRD